MNRSSHNTDCHVEWLCALSKVAINILLSWAEVLFGKDRSERILTWVSKGLRKGQTFRTTRRNDFHAWNDRGGRGYSEKKEEMSVEMYTTMQYSIMIFPLVLRHFRPVPRLFLPASIMTWSVFFQGETKGLILQTIRVQKSFFFFLFLLSPPNVIIL